MSDTSSATSGKPVSFAAPFHHKAFAIIWTATLVSNVGGWMYSVASGWLMTSLNPDPLIVALVQAANTLPICLLAIPAGALADIFDKRKFYLRATLIRAVMFFLFASAYWALLPLVRAPADCWRSRALWPCFSASSASAPSAAHFSCHG